MGDPLDELDDPAWPPETVAIWDYYLDTVWRPLHPRSKLTPRLSQQRDWKIRRALKNYGEETTKAALRGVLYSKFHLGYNKRRKAYITIELILRDADHIERFALLAEQAEEFIDPEFPPAPPKLASEEEREFLRGAW